MVQRGQGTEGRLEARCFQICFQTPKEKAPANVRRGLLLPLETGGAEGIRTPDLLLAKEALFQLSYGPSPIIAIVAVIAYRRQPILATGTP